MWIRYLNYGDLLDDGSTSTSHYKLDSGVCLSSFRNHGYGKSVHRVHESVKILNNIVTLFSIHG